MTQSSSLRWPRHLFDQALSEFPLDRFQEHGFSHWARVRAHGVSLANHYDLNPLVPSLFGLLHDCRRENDYHDPDHGRRAGALVEELALKGMFDGLISGKEIGWLAHACEGHADGKTDGPLMVQVCWDADRLDLGRVGIRPHPALLCTDLAREVTTRAHAYCWSRGRPWRQAPDEGELFYSSQLSGTSRSRSFT